ncbi:hypothetical protein QJS04_geneDACA003595 [Acorus gramineus]|uniref:Protein MIZU-KUSSEI 1 n=1 Tax=Acorus gramineus TaxID=55184 RepID=A0AAV9BKJ4_ACOGR|nr:hypothetical protein QJS04_geneDACA003595 [Acorus gramineus]
MTSTVVPETPESSPPPPPPPPSPPPRPPPSPSTLLQPSQKKRPSKSSRVFRAFRSVFRSFPILAPSCRIPASVPTHHQTHVATHGGARAVTGTLYGHRRARVTLSLQDNPRCLPLLVLELAIPTSKLQQEMSSGGLVRIALECEKRAAPAGRVGLLEEPAWTMYCNGRKAGYAARREPTEADLGIMELLRAVSMGAGVLPLAVDPSDENAGEMTYVRAHFERVVGSKDSETFYMMSPDGNSGPELSIFFVRIG